MLASGALSAKLFIPGWRMSMYLRQIKDLDDNEDYIVSIVVAYMDNVPIGVCISQRWYRYKNPYISVFVRKKYRRLGIGTKMVKRMMGKKPGFRYERGIEGSAKFFQQWRAAVDYS